MHVQFPPPLPPRPLGQGRSAYEYLIEAGYRVEVAGDFLVRIDGGPPIPHARMVLFAVQHGWRAGT